MHFSIPDTQEFKDENGANYVAYNVHINGVLHCTVRYKQLHNLHEQLKKVHDNLPSFPPKKLLPLSHSQVDDRRQNLEKYIQLVSQDSRITADEIFNGFLLNAQQESENERQEDVSLSVHLMNGQKVTVQILSTLQTDDVLEVVASAIDLPAEFVFYFALFLVRNDSDGDFTFIRRMQDFESPYISLKASKGHHRIVIRKSYWDPLYDEDLMGDRIAMNLLYVQAVSDVERGWTMTNKETRRQLVALQAKGSKREYLRLARTLRFYGYLQFKSCISDYPIAYSKATVCAGNKEMVFQYHDNNEQLKEYSFKVTRMRCWRVTTSKPSKDSQSSNDEPQLELAFQYLLCKDKLHWITVVSEYAILMSVCLQGMVEELLMKKNGGKIRKPHDRIRRGSFNYMKRDGSSHQICMSRSTSADVALENSGNDQRSLPRDSSMKKLSDKLSSVTQKSSVRSSNSAKSLVENHVFEGIGDDDL